MTTVPRGPRAMHPYGVMFHHFHGAGHPPVQGSIHKNQLHALIDHVGRQNLMPADEWLARAMDGTLRDNDVCLTFDDNLRCQFDIALPVLASVGLTALWFVPTSVLYGNLERLEIYRAFRTRFFDTIDDFYEHFLACVEPAELNNALRDFKPDTHLADFPFYTSADRTFRYVRDEVLGPARYHELMDRMIERYGCSVHELADGLWMTAEHLRCLHGRGHVIGLHSHTHPTRLAELTIDQQRREYHDNYAALCEILPDPPIAMSHPCNSYCEQTLDVLAALGIRVGFRANMAESERGPFEYRREDHANIIRDMKPCASPCSPAISPATST